MKEDIDNQSGVLQTGPAMNAQYKSSLTHARQISSGLRVAAEREIGDGDNAVSLVRYSDGSTWAFTNGDATRLEQVYGYAEANHSQEPAWFLSSDGAEQFNVRCGSSLGAPTTQSADDVELTDILLSVPGPRIAWRVYYAPEGSGSAYCGEFTSRAAAEAYAEQEPDGTWDYEWETHRAANDGVAVPDRDGVEDAEAASWHGSDGWHCVVRTIYSR